MDDSSLLDKIQDSFVDLLDRGVDFIPKLLVAALLLVVGVMVARFVSNWIGKALEYIETHPTYKSMVKRLGMNVIGFSGIVSLLARWTVLIIFLSAAVDILEQTVLTDTFNAILDFVPNIFAAALIAGLSFIAGNVVHDIVLESAKKAKVGGASVLAVSSRIVILVFGIPLAVSQLGLDLSIINNNLTVIVAGVMLALGLAFGLGGREVASKIVDDLYKNLKS